MAIKNLSKSTESTGSQRAGVSIRILSTILVATAVLAIVFSVFELQQGIMHTKSLYKMEQERQKCDKAIQQFMDGSDYLTYQVQQFVISGDEAYMDNYWKEVYETKSRDKAIAEILSTDITEEEIKAAKSAKRESDALIEAEIRAMRMVAESVGISEANMPQDVADYELEPGEAALSAEAKHETAMTYMFGPDYSFSKDAIRSNVREFRDEISNRYGAETIEALQKSETTTFYLAAAIIAPFLLLIAAIIGFSRQVVSPLIDFSYDLRKNETGRIVRLQEKGASEIKRVAKAFNILSEQTEQNTKKLERMGYIDYLTDVPNRASITEYVSDMINGNKYPLGVAIIDIDNFKRFNDTYGHTLGDEVLKQVAEAVCTADTVHDSISGRLCGEEFVVVTRNADEEILRNTAEDILRNVRGISRDDVGLPDAPDFHITVSIGGMIWHGEMPADFIRLLSKADKALYVSKETGKDKYTFYGSTTETQ